MKLMENVGCHSRYPSRDLNSRPVEQEALQRPLVQTSLRPTLCRRHQNVQLAQAVKTSDLYSSSAWFESPQGHRIYWLRIFVGFISLRRQTPGK
jgi:hypothetical protein